MRQEDFLNGNEWKFEEDDTDSYTYEDGFIICVQNALITHPVSDVTEDSFVVDFGNEVQTISLSILFEL